MFNITNYAPHPTNELYIVYQFSSKEVVDLFIELLRKENLFFENDETLKDGKTQYLVAVKSKDEKRTTHLNYFAIGKFREPLIGSKYLRLAVYIFSITILLLTIIGFVMNK